MEENIMWMSYNPFAFITIGDIIITNNENIK